MQGGKKSGRAPTPKTKQQISTSNYLHRELPVFPFPEPKHTAGPLRKVPRAPIANVVVRAHPGHPGPAEAHPGEVRVPCAAGTDSCRDCRALCYRQSRILLGFDEVAERGSGRTGHGIFRQRAFGACSPDIKIMNAREGPGPSGLPVIGLVIAKKGAHGEMEACAHLPTTLSGGNPHLPGRPRRWPTLESGAGFISSHGRPVFRRYSTSLPSARPGAKAAQPCSRTCIGATGVARQRKLMIRRRNW